MFDRCYFINLKRRPDRLANFKKLQEQFGWRLPEPIVFEAIEGDKVGVPTSFTQGGGAWGCLRSHVTCLERCVMDGVDSVLMLEDDLTWQADAWDRLDAFMKNVPSDWEQLMLGGQHLKASRPVVDGVVKCQNTQRTHAYVARGRAIKGLLNLWYTTTVHIDWAMGDWQKDYRVYAPEPFVFGQAGGKSDISGRTNPAYYWSGSKQPASKTHVLVLRAPRSVLDNATGFHRGYYLHTSGIDNGLLDAITSEDRPTKLREWMSLVGKEAEQAGSVPCVWCDAITADEVRQAAPGRTVVEVRANTAEELYKQWGEQCAS